MTKALDRQAVPLTEKRLLTIPETALYLGCSVGKVYALIDDGSLRAVDGIGRGRRIDRIDCDRLVDDTRSVGPIKGWGK